MKSSRIVWLGTALMFLTACGGNSGKTTPSDIYTITVTVTGLAGSGLVLQNNGANNLSVNGNGTFVFSNVFASGSAYDVTVLTQPSSPTQSCAVKNGQGTGTSDVTVQVTCGNIYTIGGTVTGLVGTGMVLQNNGGDNLPLNTNGSFAFNTSVASAGPYSVTVLTQPSNPAQTCTVTNGKGTAASNVTNVQVICGIVYAIGGTVTDLVGTGMVLQNNGGDNLTVNANGSFTFSTWIASGGPYNVTVLTQPSNPVQACAVTSGSGTANANITNIQVICKANLGTLTTLYSFCQDLNSNSACVDGEGPQAGLVQGQDGNFYGTTEFGGGIDFGQGTVFQYTSQGTLNILWSFCQTDCSDGAYPEALIQGSDGKFYGTTSSGGAYSSGIVFQMYQQNGTWTVAPLWSFCSQIYANGNCMDGTDDGNYGSNAPLVEGSDSAFYGTTNTGGANQSDQCSSGGCGTVFKLAEQNGTWNLTTLYSFCATTNCTDGSVPVGLMQGADGNFYGTTFGSINGAFGTVFEMTPTGTLTTLYTFCSQTNCPDGANPAAGLVQGTDGNFYGTTYNGGAGNSGTVFKITPTGALTTLYSFCSQTNCTDGANPAAKLVQASDGNFYGTTVFGGNGYAIGGGLIDGAPYVGTVFRITPAGELTKVYSFCSVTDGDDDCFDGELPESALIQATDGLFYGTTEDGGLNSMRGGSGTLFSLAALGN